MALDDQWFERFKLISIEAAEPYYYLLPYTGHLINEQARFRANDSYTPDLRPNDIPTGLLTDRYQSLIDLRSDIRRTEPHPIVREAYDTRINELLTTLALLQASASGQTQQLRNKNEQLYGWPDEAASHSVCAWLRLVATEQGAHPEPAVRSAARQILIRLPISDGDPTIIIPPADTFQIVRRGHQKLLSELFGRIDVPPIVTESRGDPIVREILTRIGCGYEVVAAQTEAWGVSHGAQQVIHPAQYRLTAAEFKGVVLHEIGSHLAERVNGLTSPLRLLGLGLDRYERGNEGRAFLREQIMYEEPGTMLRHDGWRHIISLHLAVSLGIGVFGPAWSFRQVYDLLYAINLLWFLLASADESAAKSRAAELSWTETVRVFKGTADCSVPYRKDIVYLEGVVRCWQVAAANPERILAGDRGKFDIANPRHILWLQSLRHVN